MARKNNLPDLPPSKEWDGEVHMATPEVFSDCVNCKHFFTMQTAKEIHCDKCGLGLFIGTGDELKDGSLFHNGKKVV
jgi:hypothetical protein